MIDTALLIKYNQKENICASVSPQVWFDLPSRDPLRKAVSPQLADVAELVDALDLGSSAERRGGSSPLIRTKDSGVSPPNLAFAALIRAHSPRVWALTRARVMT